MRGLFSPDDFGNRILVVFERHRMNGNPNGSSHVDNEAKRDTKGVEGLDVVRDQERCRSIPVERGSVRQVNASGCAATFHLEAHDEVRQ